MAKKDLAGTSNVDDSTFHRIASISKLISANALMKLYEQGLFKLDDDVRLILVGL